MLSLTLLLAAGCKKSEETAPITVVTYNAGLAVGFVPGAVERTEPTAAAIGDIDADIVCLQEVWLPDQIQAVTDAASDYPHSYFPDPSQEIADSAACEKGDADQFIECIDANCFDACADELPDCVIGGCALQFAGLEPACQGCVQANIGGTAKEVKNTCEQEATQYAYDGAFGTGILSKHKFVGGVEEHVFDSTTNRRSVLHAVVDSPIGQVDVYCTHLTAIFDIIPYPKEEGSWDAEQLQQIEDLRDFIDSTAKNPVVLLGDFNTGPQVDPNIAGEFPDHYRTLSAGYENPFLAGGGDACTYCPDNPLQQQDGVTDEKGRIIDHVLLKDFADVTTSASIVLDEGIDTETCGDPIDGAYSDHYGVSATITPAETD